MKIIKDNKGRINLALLCPDKKPNHWLESVKTRQLVAEYNKNNAINNNNKDESSIESIKIISTGKEGSGTYAVPELALAYAVWASPTTYLKLFSKLAGTKKKAKPRKIKERMFKGNPPPEDEGWKHKHTIQEYDSEWLIYSRQNPEKRGLTQLKVIANGTVPNKANYWLLLVGKSFHGDKSLKIMTEKRPELFKKIETWVGTL